ncbi:hypothetical protein DXG01_004660 [Tephrocybe rancida]|nr:hypothetical protein DXG01_004660 [Tephrocybe rancida]
MRRFWPHKVFCHSREELVCIGSGFNERIAVLTVKALRINLVKALRGELIPLLSLSPVPVLSSSSRRALSRSTPEPNPTDGTCVGISVVEATCNEGAAPVVDGERSPEAPPSDTGSGSAEGGGSSYAHEVPVSLSFTVKALRGLKAEDEKGRLALGGISAPAPAPSAATNESESPNEGNDVEEVEEEAVEEKVEVVEEAVEEEVVVVEEIKETETEMIKEMGAVVDGEVTDDVVGAVPEEVEVVTDDAVGAVPEGVVVVEAEIRMVEEKVIQDEVEVEEDRGGWQVVCRRRQKLRSAAAAALAPVPSIALDQTSQTKARKVDVEKLVEVVKVEQVVVIIAETAPKGHEGCEIDEAPTSHTSTAWFDWSDDAALEDLKDDLDSWASTTPVGWSSTGSIMDSTGSSIDAVESNPPETLVPSSTLPANIASPSTTENGGWETVSHRGKKNRPAPALVPVAVPSTAPNLSALKKAREERDRINLGIWQARQAEKAQREEEERRLREEIKKREEEKKRQLNETATRVKKALEMARMEVQLAAKKAAARPAVSKKAATPNLAQEVAKEIKRALEAGRAGVQLVKAKVSSRPAASQEDATPNRAGERAKEKAKPRPESSSLITSSMYMRYTPGQPLVTIMEEEEVAGNALGGSTEAKMDFDEIPDSLLHSGTVSRPSEVALVSDVQKVVTVLEENTLNGGDSEIPPLSPASSECEATLADETCPQASSMTALSSIQTDPETPSSDEVMEVAKQTGGDWQAPLELSANQTEQETPGGEGIVGRTGGDLAPLERSASDACEEAVKVEIEIEDVDEVQGSEFAPESPEPRCGCVAHDLETKPVDARDGIETGAVIEDTAEADEERTESPPKESLLASAPEGALEKSSAGTREDPSIYIDETLCVPVIEVPSVDTLASVEAGDSLTVEVERVDKGKGKEIVSPDESEPTPNWAEEVAKDRAVAPLPEPSLSSSSRESPPNWAAIVRGDVGNSVEVASSSASTSQSSSSSSVEDVPESAPGHVQTSASNERHERGPRSKESQKKSNRGRKDRRRKADLRRAASGEEAGPSSDSNQN